MRGRSASKLASMLLAIVTTHLLYSSRSLADTSADSRHTAIWFSATEPPWRTVWGYPANDYMRLFAPDAQWHTAAAHVSVFELSKRFVNETPDPVLKTVVDNLRGRHIALSIQITPLLATTQCGLGVEGHGPAHDVALIAAKLKRIGAEVAYARMDEPLWYGHIWRGTGRIRGCRTAIGDLAKQAAEKLRELRGIYPSVKIVDIEPVGAPEELAPGWTSDMAAWLDAYRSVMGEPVEALHLDVAWQSQNWRAQLVRIAKIVQSSDIALGITYNGTRLDQSDQSWTDDARSHFVEVEKSVGIVPQHAIFQSWMDFPRAMLPDTQSGTLTNLVTGYVQQERTGH